MIDNSQPVSSTINHQGIPASVRRSNLQQCCPASELCKGAVAGMSLDRPSASNHLVTTILCNKLQSKCVEDTPAAQGKGCVQTGLDLLFCCNCTVIRSSPRMISDKSRIKRKYIEGHASPTQVLVLPMEDGSCHLEDCQFFSEIVMHRDMQ
jgi:hypothetical protein